MSPALGVSIQNRWPWGMRSLQAVMPSAVRAAERAFSPMPWAVASSRRCRSGTRGERLTQPDAGLGDDGAPTGAIGCGLPLHVRVEECGGGPGTLAVEDLTGEGI